MNNALHDISYGLYIVSTKESDKKVGCVINTLVQITSKDPVVSISLNKDNHTNEVLKKTKKVAISILSEKTNKETISKFGFYSSKDINKFENIDYKETSNLPVVNDNITGYITGDVVDIIDVGTHDIFLIKVKENEKVSEEIPMTYRYYRENLKGVSPKNAPTYIENKEEGTGKKYKCKICGYIYDDSKEEVPFNKLPDDWKCPLCGAPKKLFEEIEKGSIF